MPLITEYNDSLPYIDVEPSLAERAAAEALINSELSLRNTTAHPDLPALREAHFSRVIHSELQRIETAEPLKAIDTSRYESIEAPSPDSPQEEWRSKLQQAYITTTHLQTRQTNLALLERYGKNAWLIGNLQLEGILKVLEQDLEETKTEIDVMAMERRAMQKGVEAEVKGLEESWRRGVERCLETEIAAEELKRDFEGVHRRAEGS